MEKKENLKTLDQFITEQYGEKGSAKRDKLEKGYEDFKIIAIKSLDKKLKKQTVQSSDDD